MINYNIKGTGLEITDELRTYAEKRLQRVEKFLNGDTSAHIDVELEHQAMRHGDRNRAEFTVALRGQVYRAEAWGETVHSAIDISVDELYMELSKSKKKRIDIVRRGAAKAKDILHGLRNKF